MSEDFINSLRIFWYIPKTVLFYRVLVMFGLATNNIFITIIAVIIDILAFISGYL